MKTRWLCLCFCLLGLLLLGCGLLIPVHLRAIDAAVVLSAGRSGDSVLQRGNALAKSDRLGAAELYVSAARLAGMPGWDRLGNTVTNNAVQNHGALFWGNDAEIAAVFTLSSSESLADTLPDSFSAFIIRQRNRDAALAWLKNSPSGIVQELLRCQELDHTVLFPPASSAAGQAFEAAIAGCGLLVARNHLTPALSAQIQNFAGQANQDLGSRPIEDLLMDLASLGERLNWDQLTAFVAAVPDAATLHQLAMGITSAGGRLPLLFVAIELSNDPMSVAGYLAKFPQTGLEDISSGLWYGANGIRELALSKQRFYKSEAMRLIASRDPFGAIYYSTAARSLRDPWLVLAAKWLCYLGSGVFFGLALSFAGSSQNFHPPQEPAFHARGFHALRSFLFSLGFLLIVLLLSEPFLAQESQGGGFSLWPRLPMAGGVAAAGTTGLRSNIMNPSIYLTLLAFFVLQALLYVCCLSKLAEIRRQRIAPRMKLKLLENEDHLFDAGLYLGFVGTIVSLIVASMGLVKFSLMAAYSSTSFGIIFVVIFKIFHLRPARRQMLLEAEIAEAATTPEAVLMPVQSTAPATA